jgi:hypothetical protein
MREKTMNGFVSETNSANFHRHLRDPADKKTRAPLAGLLHEEKAKLAELGAASEDE